MISHLRHLKHIVLEILFPPVCLACNKALTGPSDTENLCPSCKNDITINTAYTCPVCRGRLPGQKRACHPKADYVLAAATSYESEAIRSLIWRLKFERQTAAVKPLSNIILEFLAYLNLSAEDFIIIPIPLHKKRLRYRGFNQSELIAKELIKSWPAVLSLNALIKTKDTNAQSHAKSWAERSENIAGCFSTLDSGAIKGKNVILFDDVWTSGSTMNEAARVLKDAGVETIIALTITKAG